MQNQLSAATGISSVTVSITMEQQQHKTIWSTGGYGSVARVPMGSSMIVQICMVQKKIDLIKSKSAYGSRAMWEACESGFISKWVEDCGAVVNMTHNTSMGMDSTILFTMNIADSDKFTENVRKTGWNGYCEQFYAELEQTLSEDKDK